GSESESDRVREIVAQVGGFDIAAILGAMLACADFKKPFVIDGFITAVAAACAAHINARVVDYALPSHQSKEKGTELALAEVGITQDMVPIQAQMSMGEGTGAILMVQMLKTTQYMFVNVGTFADLMKL
ncbi:MAG: nicotinate-nucleotide--dimethylbenzimidazole phosphoribosyltransferase, partial [Veillonella parvula]